MSAPGTQGGGEGSGSQGEQTESDDVPLASDNTSTEPTIPPPAFSHQPLNLTTDQIRLVILLPGTGIAPIECEITITTLGGHQSYEALSYYWGPPPATKTITLDSQSFAVRENLFQALSNLRYPTTPRTLWIDALCIDQSNIPELNHQVQQMGTVYSTATSVLAWLGPFHLAPLGRPSHDSRPLTAPDIQRILSRPVPPSAGPWTGCASAALQTAHTDAAFARLCAAEYWRRLWIVQEVILARSVTVHFGARCMSWVAFMEMYRRTGWTGRPVAIDNQRRERGRLDGASSAKGGQPYYCRFESLLDDFGESSCQDPRDKLFGFLGVARDFSTKDIEVDYGASLQELCDRVTLKYPRLGAQLHRLWGVEIGEESVLGGKLEKWACWKEGWHNGTKGTYSGQVGGLGFGGLGGWHRRADGRYDAYNWPSLEKAGGLGSIKTAASSAASSPPLNPDEELPLPSPLPKPSPATPTPPKPSGEDENPRAGSRNEASKEAKAKSKSTRKHRSPWLEPDDVDLRTRYRIDAARVARDTDGQT